jgi:hypothetical protein
VVAPMRSILARGSDSHPDQAPVIERLYPETRSAGHLWLPPKSHPPPCATLVSSTAEVRLLSRRNSGPVASGRVRRHHPGSLLDPARITATTSSSVPLAHRRRRRSLPSATARRRAIPSTRARVVPLRNSCRRSTWRVACLPIVVAVDDRVDDGHRPTPSRYRHQGADALW